MSRTVIGMCLAAAFGVATLAAQSTSTAQTQDRTMGKSDGVTISGCLQKDASGGFVLNNAQIDTGADKASSSYGSAGATGTSGSAAASASASASTWKLEGSSSDLEEHIGHKIQVTGKEKPAAAPEPGVATGTTGKTGTSTSRSLDVKSVKMVASSCS